MSDYTYPAQLIKKTEKRIMAQLDGNGLDPASAILTAKRQGIGSFTARTTFEIDCDVKTVTRPGKVNQGKIVGNGQLQGEIAAYSGKVLSNKSLTATVEAMIKKLPLEGFGADKQRLSITGNQEILTEHKTCGNCAGQGQSQCHICHGQGRIQCRLCNGHGELQCMTCGGQGQTTINGQTQICTMCQGRGRSFCTQCHGQKIISCTQCQSKGFVVCKGCGGEGASSVVTTITPVAVTMAQIHLQELDDDPKRMASLVGAEKLAAGGHITVATTKPPEEKEEERAWYQDAATTDTSGIYYLAKMPWAVTVLEIGKQTYDIALIGNKGAIAETKPFMDVLFKHPANLLQQAATGGGYVAGLLKEACQYRVSRETLIAVITGRKKNAMIGLQKTYAIGLSKEMIQKLVKDAYLSLKRVTRRPRYIGLGIGLALCVALCYAWFIGGLQQAISGGDRPRNIGYAIDLIILFVGMGLSVTVVKSAGYFTLRSVMRDLKIETRKIPAAGTAGIYAIIGSVIIWGGFFAIRYFNIL